MNIPHEILKQVSPCFVLDEVLLRRNLEVTKRVQQEAGVKIILALKGFSMFSAFPLIRQYLPGTTASSLNEALLGAEMFGGEVHAYAPVYFEKEFEKLTDICGHITFNSIAQFEKFHAKAHSKGVSCGIRINPEYSPVETDLYNPCVAGSRLGVRREDMQELPKGIDGLHSHNLCENNSFELEKTLQAIESRFGDFLPNIKWLNLGGGHLMTHKDYQVDHLIQVLKAFKAKYPHLELILEPGSAIAWQTGYLVSTVQDIVHSKGIDVLMLDVSVSAHMPDCIEMPYKARIIGATDPTPNKPTYRVGGLTCLAGDFMGDYSFDKEVQVGDVLVFDDMMHYTMVKTTTFNGVNLPSIGIWTESGAFNMIRSFGYEDFKSRLS